MIKEYICLSDIPTLLVTQKGIDNTTINSQIFEEKTYLNSMKPYLDLFATGRDPINQKRLYPDKVDFKKYIECNKLDAAISGTLHLYIGCFEKRLRCFVIDKICGNMRAIGDIECKNVKVFEDYKKGLPLFDFLPYPTLEPKSAADGKFGEAIDKVISRMNPAKETSHILSEHYRTKHGFIPAFVVLQTLSLGDLVSLFSHLSLANRRAFVSAYRQSNAPNYFSESDMRVVQHNFVNINIMRNIINHYQPIFPYISNYKPYMVKTLEDNLMFLKKNYQSSKSVASFTFEMLPLSFSGAECSADYFHKITCVIDALS